MNRPVIFSLILILFSEIHLYAREESAGLTVAAAANLQPALEELKTAFERKARVKIKTVLGSSGRLTAQIGNGAPFDIFLSADMKYPETLYKEGFSSQPPKIYAYGVLVLWSTKKMDSSQGMDILKDPGIKKIALANPQVSPYGRESVNALEYDKLYSVVNKKLVYGESIAQVNDFIVSQSADIGFTTPSTVLSQNLKHKGVWIEVPIESYRRIAQGAIILKHKENEERNNLLAEKFYSFLFSPEAGEILKRYGYTVDE